MCAWCQTKLQKSKIFNSLLKVQNLCSSTGLVKISASCLSVLTWLRAMSPFEWFTWLLASLIALSLLYKSGILINLQPKLLKVNLIQTSCAQVPVATYSASAVDSVTP
jgi:hypothetical protein